MEMPSFILFGFPSFGLKEVQSFVCVCVCCVVSDGEAMLLGIFIQHFCGIIAGCMIDDLRDRQTDQTSHEEYVPHILLQYSSICSIYLKFCMFVVSSVATTTAAATKLACVRYRVQASERQTSKHYFTMKTVSIHSNAAPCCNCYTNYIFFFFSSFIFICFGVLAVCK